MRKISAFVFVAFLFSVTTATAAIQSTAYNIYGAGNAQCGALIDNRAIHINSANVQWFIGFLTAVSIINKSDIAPLSVRGNIERALSEYDNDDFVSMIDNECRLNRSLYLYEVANIWVGRLNR